MLCPLVGVGRSCSSYLGTDSKRAGLSHSSTNEHTMNRCELTLLWSFCLLTHFLLLALPVPQVNLKVSVILIICQRALFPGPQALGKYGIHYGHLDLNVLSLELDELVVPGLSKVNPKVSPSSRLSMQWGKR